MPLSGTLRDLSLASLVQLQCSERQHAQVSLVGALGEGRLIFAAGELIFASVGALKGEEAVQELLTWDDAEFHVDHEAVTAERNVSTPWPALLLQGTQRVDEARAERDGQMETLLRSAQGTHGLRAAILVNSEGRIRASGSEGQAAAEAPRVAFLAGRLEAIGAMLNCGAFREALFSTRAEKLWITKKDGSYLACWLEGRASLGTVASLLRPFSPSDRAAGAG
jgi:hypothetical protein